MNAFPANYAFFGTIYFPASTEIVTGQNVNLVRTESGTFRETRNQVWIEKNEQGENISSYKEITRDDWSIYLQDSSRNVNIQLDLHARKVMHSVGNDPQVTLHSIKQTS
ncbi:hypothetical protein [Leucothrix arctica]|uniref:Uncharacterized protein n=1 Tax=Leucothrix arctica TaxID=1481894 RepID=A0A317CJA7_9GAMM|nr:hypothetical protein [Leucothrix arctica]PWQ97513.1 hypothetical protein DKT75_06205 [Leucothrix arctica]